MGIRTGAFSKDNFGGISAALNEAQAGCHMEAVAAGLAAALAAALEALAAEPRLGQGHPCWERSRCPGDGRVEIEGRNHRVPDPHGGRVGRVFFLQRRLQH